ISSAIDDHDVIPAQAGIQSPKFRRPPWTPAFAGVTAGFSHREAGPARRQTNPAARRFEHVIARHLHDIAAPIELLGLVFEEIGRRERVAIGLDIAVPSIVADRRVAPAEFPPGMLGADPPAIE